MQSANWCSFDNFDAQDNPHDAKSVAEDALKKLFKEISPNRQFGGSDFNFIQVSLILVLFPLTLANKYQTSEVISTDDDASGKLLCKVFKWITSNYENVGDLLEADQIPNQILQ